MPLLNKNIENNILHIQLNDPESRNAFSPTMAEEFASALENEPFEALLVTASGSQFCSGGNLRFYKNLKTKEEGLSHNHQITVILNKLEFLKKPTICVVQGPCYGGGVELISAFDRVVATPDSLFGLWQRRIGLTFGWGGEPRLLRRLGSQRLKAWLFGAQTVSAYQAKEWGLVDEIYVESEAVVEAKKWLMQVMRHGEETFSHVKKPSGEQANSFKGLWMGDKHKQVLDQF